MTSVTETRKAVSNHEFFFQSLWHIFDCLCRSVCLTVFRNVLTMWPDTVRTTNSCFLRKCLLQTLWAPGGNLVCCCNFLSCQGELKLLKKKIIYICNNLVTEFLLKKQSI